jgi:hypothetical protein
VRTRGHLYELGWTFGALGCGVLIAAAASCAREEVATASAAPGPVASEVRETRAASALAPLPGPMEVYPYAVDAPVPPPTPDARPASPPPPAVDAVTLPPAADAEPPPRPPRGRDAGQPLRPRR